MAAGDKVFLPTPLNAREAKQRTVSDRRRTAKRTVETTSLQADLLPAGQRSTAVVQAEPRQVAGRDAVSQTKQAIRRKKM